MGISDDPRKANVVCVALHHDDAETQLDQCIKGSCGADQIVNLDALFARGSTAKIIRARIADHCSIIS